MCEWSEVKRMESLHSGKEQLVLTLGNIQDENIAVDTAEEVTREVRAERVATFAMDICPRLHLPREIPARAHLEDSHWILTRSGSTVLRVAM